MNGMAVAVAAAALGLLIIALRWTFSPKMGERIMGLLALIFWLIWLSSSGVLSHLLAGAQKATSNFVTFVKGG